MSGLLLFWDARLVTTSPWDIVCHQQNGYTEGVNKTISAKNIETTGDICCHLNLKVMILIISLLFIFWEVSLFHFFGLPHFVLPKFMWNSPAISAIFPFPGLVFKIGLAVLVFFLQGRFGSKYPAAIHSPNFLILVRSRAGPKTDFNTHDVNWVIPATS